MVASCWKMYSFIADCTLVMIAVRRIMVGKDKLDRLETLCKREYGYFGMKWNEFSMLIFVAMVL